jgi:hypothetical protein
MVLRAPSPDPMPQDSSLVAPGTRGRTSAPATGEHRPLRDELGAVSADRDLPAGQPLRAKLLWAKRYSGHILFDLYVVNAAAVGPAASFLCVLPASPWSSLQTYWLLHRWTIASRVALVEMTAGTARPSLRVSCVRFDLVLAVDHWPAVHR